MDPASGTFASMDTYAGSLSDPMSLHKYLFANSNPVMYSDPSGHEATLQGIVTAMTISAILSAADSGITYYLKYKDSDTAKYGKTVFGWNVATAAMNGFLNGFILGVFFYALCSLLVVRMVLSVIGLCLGIQQGTNGLDEIISSDGNTAYGIYNLIMGSVLICVSTYGIAKTGAEILNRYGDGIERSGSTSEITNEQKSGHLDNPIEGLERKESGLKEDYEKPLYGDSKNKGPSAEFYKPNYIEREFYPQPLEHGFSDIVDNYANSAQAFYLNDGAVLYQVEGSYNGINGVFEWIVDKGYITHRRFKAGGYINGFSN